MGNIGGWLEDAAAAIDNASYHGPSKSMPSVEVRTQFVPYPLTGVISPWNAPMMLALLDAIPALFAGAVSAHLAQGGAALIATHIDLGLGAGARVMDLSPYRATAGRAAHRAPASFDEAFG